MKWDASGTTLKNLSASGTLLNGSPVAAATLKDGDIISAGYIECEYGRRPALQLKVCLRESDSAQPAGLCLICLGCGASKLFPGPLGTIRVGRSMQAPEFWNAVVPDETLRNAISRQHFEVSAGERLLLKNLSLAGTLVNGHMVQQQHKLQNGDIIAIPLHGVHEAPPIVQFCVEYRKSMDPKDLEPILEGPADPVVQVKSETLPPPFSIQCIAAGVDVTSLPNQIGCLKAPFSKAQVGSARSSFGLVV